MKRNTAAARTVGSFLVDRGVSRRSFLKYCIATATSLGLSPMMGSVMAENLAKAKRPSVIYLSFQECTGCMESLTRAFSPSVENLILNSISLDYNHTLMAPSGHAAEAAREEAMAENYGSYLVIVDGAIPTGGPGFCTVAGHDAQDIMREVAAGAAAVISIGTCASYGGIPKANPNPTGAVPVSEIVTDKPVVNIPGCPPIPEVMAATLAHFLSFGSLPELDEFGRPMAFFGNTIHDRCYRRPFYDEGKFAKTFDDEGARRGYCLYELGCKGPTTYNACATVKWNNTTSFPIESGHGCIGCSEPDFWDKGSFYAPVSAGLFSGKEGLIIGTVAGAALGAGAAWNARRKRNKRLAEQGEGGTS
ncbi:MAG: hydrogenase small subunit [Xanthomonadales bacterium]|nr:hydrogenase small subunit [Xanthomonadales bacterium]